MLQITVRTFVISKATKSLAAMLICGLLAGCSSGGSGQNPQEPNASNSAVASPPKPTPEPLPEFAQEFNKRSAGKAATLTVGASNLGTSLSDDNIGVSFEATELSDPRWDPAAGNLDEMLIGLGQPGLRFGGNVLDREMFWTSTGEKAPKGKTLVTPQDLERVMKTVEKIDAKVTIGIPLGTYDPKRGADMAKYAVEIFGDHLVGISIGNEPNGYTNDARPGLQIREPSQWNEKKFVTQVRAYAKEIDQETGPEVPLVGPGVFDGSWMSAFLDAKLPNTTALTQHYYATYDCSSDNIPGRGPEWQNLLDPVVSNSAKKMIGIGLEKAEAKKLPLWVEETGSTSCPGTNNTSRTHASALWTVDHIFDTASMGVERMNMHSMLGACRGGAPMSVVCSAEGTGELGAGQVLAQPNYLAMRLARLSIGSQFMKTTLSGDKNLQGYAVKAKNGRVLVTVVNKNDAAKNSKNPVTVNVPQGYKATRAAQIHAPGNGEIEATELTAIAPFAAKGSGVTKNAAGKLQLDVAASSATTIEFTK
ncbi:hypothetical protein [Glutamicibacter sp. AOP3-A1-12]|uniref:hypothetical protein n=1 Tax=Glutamicibacter sp. AOP3-A1-12 TaxID=3457701 RepID=UPI000BB7196E